MSTSAASNSFPDSGNVSRSVLPDGTILLVRENPVSPAVVVQGAVLAGAVDDPPDRPGLCRFTAECLTRGTQQRSAAELYELVESVGGSLGVGAGLHTIRFGAKCLSDDLQMIVELVSEVLHSPSFPAMEIEKVRGEIITELEERDNDTRSVTDLAFRKLAYPENHPYSRPADGEKETVAGFTRDDVQHFFHSLVRQRPAIISVVGNLRKDAVEKLFVPLWSMNARTADPAPLPECARPDGRRETYRVIPGKVQVDLAWGTIGPPRNHPDF
ncbi:MAG TPA: pitrilysin family protein, partial [Candidatus Latescibacteria bacterium]|nr:pitrilysin family protein [Candidatus Latescibacterota bacterium]